MHFNAAKLEVQDLSEDMAISVMKRDLKRSRFTYSLDKNYPWIYFELLDRAFKYIHVNEVASDHRRVEDKSQKKKQKKSETPANSSRHSIDKRALPSQQSPKPNRFGMKFNSYTPLTAHRT